MWNLTHNIFYLGNVYAEIIKIFEKYNVTYGDLPGVLNLVEYGVAGTNKRMAVNYSDIFISDELECIDRDDNEVIKYNNVIPKGKYPIFDDDDYFIQNPFADTNNNHQ